jgi:D-glycero-D-manno-heptose 1,7-bisphosphate phosphatase
VTFSDVGVFFDRDGTINDEVDFLRDPDELELIPGAAQAIHEANELGIKVFVITNQSGIARGFLTEGDLRLVHDRLVQLLAREGARIDEILYCPHHPLLGIPQYRIECACRKPKPGMLLQAAATHRINLSKSYVVGDRCVDIEAGRNAGCKTALVLTGYGLTERDECVSRLHVDDISSDAYHAWKHIRRQIVHERQETKRR